MKLMELYADKIFGAIRGLDRVRFRGTVRWLANDSGMRSFLSYMDVLLKDFGHWAENVTARLRASCAHQAKALGVETIYLASSGIDKEALAQEVAQTKGIKEGSICMFSVVEPCWSAVVEGNRAQKKLGIHLRPRKCVWVYHYWNDPTIGFGHVRLQTWIPFTVQICINGRHWLERQLLDHGIGYIKDGNCFPWLEDVSAAQVLLDEQLQTDWPSLLGKLLHETCPLLPDVFGQDVLRYYWSADETEWATDVMFRSVDALNALFPTLLHHGMHVSDSPAVMRYFGKRNLYPSGNIHGNAPREITSDLRRRYEGIRIKHWINDNSIKLYNKSGSVLRGETTINNTRDFKVFRCPDDDEERPPSWQKLRKGVSDLHRRCEISDQSNTRYLDALSAAQVEHTLQELVTDACNPCRKHGRRYRAINPWRHDDFRLLTFLAKGELAINGFRNKDLRQWLKPDAEKLPPEQRKKLSALVTRRIQLLRSHSLIRKVPKVNRYVLSPKGQTFVSALLTASALEAKALMEKAA